MKLRDMTKLAPGVYDDNRGGLHIEIPEFLEANGYADTPANRAMLIATWRESMPDTPLYIVEDEKKF